MRKGYRKAVVVSPILANIFAHQVIDTWFEAVVKRHCTGQVALYRYADDAVICCQYTRDAERILRALRQRLTKYGLRLHDEKTRLVPFHPGSQARRAPRSLRVPGLHLLLGSVAQGVVIPKLKTSGKRLRTKLTRVKEWARTVKDTVRLPILWNTFCAKLRGAHPLLWGVL